MQMPGFTDVIGGRYQLEGIIGKGAMGVVYAAKHATIEREFAIKVLLPKLSIDKEYRTRFLREARINARLAHPNVVQVFDTGDHDGLLFTVMELLQGGSLQQLVSAGQLGGVEEIFEIGVQIASALDAAHQLALVHRDVKPENVIVEVDDEGVRRCVLVDFGLAFITDSSDLGRMTTSGSVVSGTPLYMSPEQVAGSDIGPESDVYSLGCLLYELVCGETPFESADDSVVRIMSKHLFTPPTPLSQRAEGVPYQLEELILAMLEKEAARRPSAARVVAALHDMANSAQNLLRGGSARPRHERMVEAPTRRGNSELSATARLSVGRSSTTDRAPFAVIGGRLDEDMEMALAANGFGAVYVETVAQAVNHDVFAVLLLSPTPKLIQESRTDLLVVAAAPAGDLQAVSDLIRFGAHDVVSDELLTQELTRKLGRQLRKSRRRRRAR